MPSLSLSLLLRISAQLIEIVQVLTDVVVTAGTYIYVVGISVIDVASSVVVLLVWREVVSSVVGRG